MLFAKEALCDAETRAIYDQRGFDGLCELAEQTALLTCMHFIVSV